MLRIFKLIIRGFGRFFLLLLKPAQLVYRLLVRLTKLVRSRSRSRAKTLQAAGVGAGAVMRRKDEPIPVSHALVRPEDLQDVDFQIDQDHRTIDQESGLVFRALPLFRLMEPPGPLLDLEGARKLAQDAAKFSQEGINIFPQLDEFYEKVEIEYVRASLEANGRSVDRRFIFVMEQMRMITNDNTRSIFLVVTPIVFMATLLLSGLLLAFNPVQWNVSSALDIEVFGVHVLTLLTTAGLSLLGVTVMHFITAMPYRYRQSINASNVSQYILAKFTRMREMYDEARRKTQDVEKDHMREDKDALKAETILWVKTMYWMGQRIYLCETLVRNTIFQIRRNAELYQFAGFMFMSVIVAVCAGAAYFFAGDARPGWPPALIVACLGALMIGLLLATTLSKPIEITEKAIRASSSNWPRYSSIGLSAALAERVGSDKADLLLYRNKQF